MGIKAPVAPSLVRHALMGAGPGWKKGIQDRWRLAISRWVPTDRAPDARQHTLEIVLA